MVTTATEQKIIYIFWNIYVMYAIIVLAAGGVDANANVKSGLCMWTDDKLNILI